MELSLVRSTLTSPESVQFFNNIQSLGYWFIDGASEIVVVPDSQHRWLILTLYTTTNDHWILVGYCFLYVFTNPFTSPCYSLRLCQILILPCYQKQGHSAHIFDVIYRILMHTSPSQYLPNSYPSEENQSGCCNYYMFTVEDPCEEFTFVRDVVDCRILKSNVIMLSYLMSEGIKEFTKDDIERIRCSLGINSVQLQKCYNILLHHRYSNIDSKEYRLFVRFELDG